MKKRDGCCGGKWQLVTVCCLVVACLAGSPDAFGGAWKHSWMNDGRIIRSLPADNLATGGNRGVAGVGVEGQASAPADEFERPSLAVASSNPKLFWVECDSIAGTGDGAHEVCGGSLWYADPLAVPVQATLYESGIAVTDRIWNGITSFEDHSIVTADIEFATYHMSNVKIGYITYFKNGKLYKVDTTTLQKTQVSNEAAASNNQLCDVMRLIDWQDPGYSTIVYHLRGNDNSCWSQDDQWRAARLNMDEATNPINLNTAMLNIDRVIFDGNIVVLNLNPSFEMTVQRPDFSSSPTMTVEKCDHDLVGCTTMDTFTNNAHVHAYDKNFVVLEVDGKLKRYDLVTDTLRKLFSPLAGQRLDDVVLDRDGTVFFAVIDETAPYNSNYVKKAAVAGKVVTVTNLATVKSTATAPYPWLFLSLAENWLTYAHLKMPSEVPAQTISSVPKSGGTSKLLTSSLVNGGAVGDYVYCEDTTGALQKIKIDGTGKETRKNTLLSGATLGDSADWYYQFDVSTFKGIFSTIDNKTWVSAYSDTLAAGALLGTLPVNLSNFGVFSVGAELLGLAGRRGTDVSWGRDVLLVTTGDSQRSLHRLTDRNRRKLVFETGF